MTQTITLYKVFVASPSDVNEERGILDEIINELNLTLPKKYNIRLELLKWETHANPDIGESPQQIINEDIGNDYDIFIGILWSKFGTPTPNYLSGTQEEFFKALQMYKDKPGLIKIMFYFKKADIPYDMIDTKSIDSIRSFKEDLTSKKTLYWEYKSIDEFQSLIRIQLTRQILELDSLANTTSKPKSTSEKEQIEGELGLLDYIEAGEESFSMIKEILGRVNNAMEWISERFIHKTEEINIQNRINPLISTSVKKHLADSIARDLDTFIKRVQVEIPLFAETFKTGIDNFSSVLKISMEYKADKKEDIEEAMKSFIEAKDAAINAKDAYCSARDSMLSFPNISKTINKSKKIAASTLDNMIKEFETAINLIEALQSEFEEYLKMY
jgi:Domain of unknown function (DUF4062)